MNMRQSLPLMTSARNKQEEKRAGSSKLPVGDVQGREKILWVEREI
jgi:hypothetical protein